MTIYINMNDGDSDAMDKSVDMVVIEICIWLIKVVTPSQKSDARIGSATV